MTPDGMITIRYTGDHRRSEVRVTGRGKEWWPGELRTVPMARGLQLLAAGQGWERDDDEDDVVAITPAQNAAGAVSLAVQDSQGRLLGADGSPVSGGEKLPSNASTLRRSRTVHPSPPTITYSLSAPTGKRWALPWGNIATPVGCALSFNNSTWALNADAANGFFGVETIVSGTEVTLGWRTSLAAGERCMVFLDGQPCMSAPATPSVSTTAGGYVYLTVTFGAAVTDARLEILTTSANSLVGLYMSGDTSCVAAPAKRKLMIVGDSFNAGSAAISDVAQLPASLLAIGYDVSVSNNALGGTGWLTDNGSLKRWSDASRLTNAQKFAPDKLVFVGSVNDDDKTATLQAAVTATLLSYRAVVPTTCEIVVYGPQPSAAVETLSVNRTANNRAVRRACEAVGVTFRDMIGTAGDADLPAFTAGMTCQPGQRYTYLGSVWEFQKTSASVMPGAYAPGNGSLASFWKLVTAMGYYGTGRVGATVGDGSRDTLLYSDGIHPTPRACANLAGLLTQDI